MTEDNKPLFDRMAELLEYAASWHDVTEFVKEAQYLTKRYKKEREHYREDTLRIEINFPRRVNIPDSEFQRLVNTVSEICRQYEQAHLGRVMWPAGMGSKITYMPMTREEELAGKHMEFDTDTLSIDCCEREDYDWPCKKCNHVQGDHKSCILNPPAGECEFEPADHKPRRKL